MTHRWCVLLLIAGLLSEGSAVVAQSARDDYSILAQACFPIARKEARTRVCSLDTGNTAGIRDVAKNGNGRTRQLAQELLELLSSNSVSTGELADYEKDLALNVAQGLFSENRKDLADAVIGGADAARKAEALRARIMKRQEQLDVIVFEKLPRLAADLAGPKTIKPLLQIHPFYRALKVTRSGVRPGSLSFTGVQHFLVDLRNNGDQPLHRVTVQVEMRDAEDRVETYLGFWEKISADEVVPLCTWKTVSNHTDHYAGCAIANDSHSHFVRYAAKIWCDEGRVELPEAEFEHRRFTTDLVSHERTQSEAETRKKREAEAKSRAESLLATKGSRKSTPVAKTEQPAVSSKPEASETPVPDEGDEGDETERYLEDFSAGTGDDPEGWSQIEGKRPLRVDRSEGKPFLTTQINVASASQSPLISIRGDFFLELSVLSTEKLADGPGKLDATFEGRDGVKPFALSIVKNDKGFEFSVTGAEEESRSAPLGGRKPHKIRLERQETAHRILVDGKVVLKHAAGEAPDYDVLKLGLANYGLRIYRIQIGPLKK